MPAASIPSPTALHSPPCHGLLSRGPASTVSHTSATKEEGGRRRGQRRALHASLPASFFKRVACAISLPMAALHCCILFGEKEEGTGAGCQPPPCLSSCLPYRRLFLLPCKPWQGTPAPPTLKLTSPYLRPSHKEKATGTCAQKAWEARTAQLLLTTHHRRSILANGGMPTTLGAWGDAL